MKNINLDFNIFIINEETDSGPFGLCVIYNRKQPIPLIKKVSGKDVYELYDLYLDKANIQVINSDKLLPSTHYGNFCKTIDGYEEMSAMHLNGFTRGYRNKN